MTFKRKTLSLAGVSLLCILAACQAKPAHETAQQVEMEQSPSTNLIARAGSRAEAPAASPAQDTDGAPAKTTGAPLPDVTLPQVAYDYNYGFTANDDGVQALVKRHQAICEDAGPAACQIVSRNSNVYRDSAYANEVLELRVSSTWLKAWQAGLEGDMKAAGGKIERYTIASEDLSLEIVDTEARLKTKEALRDRMVEMIRSHSGKISELMEAETQVAEVQADIDAARSALAVMSRRVATVHVTLAYRSESVAASKGTFSPLGEALNGVVGNIVLVLAGLISILSFLIPLGLVAAPVIWFVRKWLKNRKKKAPVVPAPDNETT
ncbi:hypothetical protein ABAC460_18395 [Asticcacaulis sp. AC460]|uniref:DUF4349 domain-containing protein n=1 Tax=Asticcacaulis sp. AC460 TaxID=1282360 RepID=UPI0003C3BDD7|nr:DUF4349 domain-containing protein [Asticcacaulis sp. AC460]ESQ87646.1 hypothetical protein ABAC460_18395 [Asticcacaulis sp. AC460]